MIRQQWWRWWSVENGKWHLRRRRNVLRWEGFITHQTKPTFRQRVPTHELHISSTRINLNSIVCVCDRFVTLRKEAVSLIILSNERATTRSDRFRNSLRWPIYIINSVEKIKLSCSQVSQVIVLSGAISMKLFVKKITRLEVATCSTPSTKSWGY